MWGADRGYGRNRLGDLMGLADFDDWKSGARRRFEKHRVRG